LVGWSDRLSVVTIHARWTDGHDEQLPTCPLHLRGACRENLLQRGVHKQQIEKATGKCACAHPECKRRRRSSAT